MLIQNWPTAFVLIVFMITAAIAVTSVITVVINRDKPLARHCVRCHKEIEEEARNNQFGGQPDE